MKKIYKDKILHIQDTPKDDNIFVFEYFSEPFTQDIADVEIVYLADLLEEKKNTQLLDQLKDKPAMYSNVYAPSDELEIFREIFESALAQKKRIHIVWVTLKKEIEMLETYYQQQWYFNEDINCYTPDFKDCLVTVSVKIENLMWKWSDYKRMREKIFFCPPIRESGENKAMFKWINRGVIAGIDFWEMSPEKISFLTASITDEKILPITLAKTLKYNLEDIGVNWDIWNFELEF